MSDTSATFTCHSCGASLTYKPGTDSLICTHCGSTTAINVQKDTIIEEKDLLEYLKKGEDYLQTTSKVINCRQCGAESTFEEHIKSTSCPYCNTPLVEADIHEERLVKPSYILPFQISKEETRSHLSKWIGKLWFAPNKLKQQLRHSQELKGVYIPYWTYDAQTETTYQGQRCDKYTRTSGSGENKRVETHTVWRDTNGRVSAWFDDIMIPASRYVPFSVMDKIRGWDMKSMVKADPQFLSGFITEKYTIDFTYGFEMAKGIMAAGIQKKIYDEIGGYDQKILSSTTRYSNLGFKLILLPVYVSSYTYRNKLYHFYMNGRNGTITGDRPYSFWKIFFTIIGTLLVIGAGIAFLQ